MRFTLFSFLFALCSIFAWADHTEHERTQYTLLAQAWAHIDSNEPSNAEKLFLDLLEKPATSGIRSSALQGLLNLQEDQALFIRDQLTKQKDPSSRRAIIRLVPKLPISYDNGIKLLEHPTLNESEQISLIEFLANRRDSSIAPYLAQLLDHDAIEVVQASITALGFVGEVDQIQQLLLFTKDTKDELNTLAIDALSRMRGEAIDQALVKHLDNPDSPYHLPILEILGHRNTQSAATKILAFTQKQDISMRLEAIKTFSKIASYKYLDQSLERLSTSQKAEIIREWSRVILTLAERSPDIEQTIQHLEIYAQRYPHTEQTITNILRRLRS